jgi:mono/diheme cytochrome c family protein
MAEFNLNPIKKNILRMFGVVLFAPLIWMFPAFADHEPQKAQCPQTRQTPEAPDEFLNWVNPLPLTAKRIEKGKLIYQSQSSPLQCKHCHGVRGDGTGHMGLEANPPARNFTCAETMKNISDGQMFWVIKNGAPGTAMPAYADLADWQIGVLIHYIRQWSDN